jgi:hypothetical protein
MRLEKSGCSLYHVPNAPTKHDGAVVLKYLAFWLLFCLLLRPGKWIDIIYSPFAAESLSHANDEFILPLVLVMLVVLALLAG